MHTAIKKALMLAQNRRQYQTGGVPDEASQESFLQEQLQGSAPQYEPQAGLETAKQFAQSSASMTTPGAIADAAGYLGGPSALQNLRDRNYFDAALQLAAVVPGVGPLSKAAKIAKEAEEAADIKRYIEKTTPNLSVGRRYKTTEKAKETLKPGEKLVHTTIENPPVIPPPIKRNKGGSIIDRGMKIARRVKSQNGGSRTIFCRKDYEPVRGIKFHYPNEFASDQPDIQAYQMKRHAHEFIGSPEPEAPQRGVYVDAPLFGGRNKLFNMSYYYQPLVEKALNLIYGQKTTPFYYLPETAPIARAIDAYEAAKFVQRDPSSLKNYTGVPGTLMGLNKLGAPAVVAGAVAARDPDNIDRKEPEKLETFDYGETPEIISHPKSEPTIKRQNKPLEYAKGGNVDDEFHQLMAEADELLEKFKD